MMNIRQTAATRRFLESNPKLTRNYEWLPLYEVSQGVVTILHGKLLMTPFQTIPTHDEFCDWLEGIDQHWFEVVSEPVL
jgi:hypothetical protein